MSLSNADATKQLAYLIERLIKVIRYDNKYAYALLKKATLGKKAVIQLDESRLTIEAHSSPEEDYFLVVETEDTAAMPVFKTTGTILKNILAGSMTIDKAIADNAFYVQGKFSEVLDIYRLALCLLTDGPLNPNLRKLWEEFCDTWQPAETSTRLTPLENQMARYDRLVAAIPQDVLNIGLRS